jgi:hypothetical protein
MAAQITIDQPSGAGAGTPGESRSDIWLSQQVDLTSSGTGSTYLWEVLDRPPGSTAPLNNPATSVADITPDVAGSYRIRLTVDGGGSGNITTRIVRARYTSTGILTHRGWAPPAVEENDDEDNEGGNTRGWAPEWETIVTDIDAALTTLVYRPASGVNAGHVFDDWATLYETFLGIEGPVEIEIDDSVTSPATIPAGTWDMEERALFVGVGSLPSLRLWNGAFLEDPAGFRQLNVYVSGTDVGSVVMNASTLLIIEDVGFQNLSTGGPLISLDSGSVWVRGLSTIATSTVQPAILFSPTATAFITLEDSASIGVDAMAGTPVGVTVNLIGVSSSCSSTQTGLAGPLTINGPTLPEPYTFVFRPGYAGAPQPNVYTSWSALMTELGLVDGPKIVQFDDTDGACQIPSGTWDFGDDTTLVGVREGALGTGVIVTVLNGGVLRDVHGLGQGLILRSTSATPILTWSTFGTSTPRVLHLNDGAQLDSTGASNPFANLGDGDHLIVVVRETSRILRGATAVIDLRHANAWLGVRVFDQGGIFNDVISILAGTAEVNLLSNTAQYKHAVVVGLTVNRVASRRRVFDLSKSNLTEATGTPVIVGAAYIDPEELPNDTFGTQFNRTAKFRVVMETTAPGQAATMDLFDTNGVFNTGTPAPITGSQHDTATGTGPSRPGGGTPLTPNPLVASAYEVDVSAIFFGGAWTNPGVYEARLWIAVAGGGNVATCKSAELIIEW